MLAKFYKVVALRMPLFIDYIISGAGKPTGGGYFPINTS